MAKYCSNCRHALQDRDRFCSICGTPVGGQPQAPLPPAQFEYCEIDLKTWEPVFWQFFNDFVFSGYFVAKAVGPKGAYIAAQSIKVTGQWSRLNEAIFQNKRKAEEACNYLVNALVSQGWEPIGRGGNWWSYKFRRLVRT